MPGYANVRRALQAGRRAAERRIHASNSRRTRSNNARVASFAHVVLWDILAALDRIT